MPPNIIFILIDDLGVRDLTCFGSSFYETPHLDQLAKQGMRFTNAYAACPVCSPTRAAIMSGKYPARVGITNWIGGNNAGRLASVPYLHYLPLEEVSLGGPSVKAATRLSASGTSAMNLFTPRSTALTSTSAVATWVARTARAATGHRTAFHAPDGPPGEYLTDRLTTDAITLVKNRDRTRPFFLNLCHYAVHTPIQRPPISSKSTAPRQRPCTSIRSIPS